MEVIQLDFKWSELKDALMRREGTTPILIEFVAQLLMGFCLLFPLFLSMGAIMYSGDGYSENDVFAGMAFLGMFLFLLLVMIPIGSFLSAGAYGSFKKVVTLGESGGLKGYIQEGKTYFWRILGLNLLMGFLVFIVVLFAGMVMAAFDTVMGLYIPFLSEMLVVFPATLLVGFVAPLVFLSVFEGSAFDNYTRFLKENGQVLFVVLLVYALLSAVPILGTFVGIVALVYPLYVMVLYVDYPFLKKEEDPDAFQGEEVGTGEQDPEEQEESDPVDATPDTDEESDEKVSEGEGETPVEEKVDLEKSKE